MELTFTAIASVVVLGYLCLVQSLRWRRYNAVHEKYRRQFETQTLTPEEAQQILHVGALYDMPSLVKYSLAFSLFKAAAIPSISMRFRPSKEKGPKVVSKRYADTEILISTWFSCPVSGFFDPPPNKSFPDAKPDPRAMVALARVNWLHSRYKISNDDYIYSLSIFALEPARWARRYGWREFSPLECYAYYIFWVEIGRRMGMQDIPDSLEEMKAWSAAYEESHMLPAQSNKEIADYTLQGLRKSFLPKFLTGGFSRRLATCFLEDRVRIAMVQPAQPWYMHAIVDTTFYSLAFVQRWLCLPRWQPMRSVDISEPKVPANGSCPRLHPTSWQRPSWYRAQSSGLGYIRDWLSVLVGYYSEMPGLHLRSHGYRLEELGPVAVETQGHDKIFEMASDLLGCPVVGTSYKPS